MKKNKLIALVLGIIMLPLFYQAYFNSEDIAVRGMSTIIPMAIVIILAIVILIIGSTNPDDSH